MNLHVHNKDGSHEEIIERFLENFYKLDPNCRARLTIENDDKLNCWSVRQLIDHFHNKTNIPICFDYLHHKCHPDDVSEKDAFLLCGQTWKGIKPLFHYSESREGSNPRAHADYPKSNFSTYDTDVDVDFEFKMKDKAIEHFKKLIINN
jgi:UV DNA damage endonuclease